MGESVKHKTAGKPPASRAWATNTKQRSCGFALATMVAMCMPLDVEARSDWKTPHVYSRIGEMSNVLAKNSGSKRRLVIVLFLAAWLLKLISGLIDVSRRHVPSYPDAIRGWPNIGQMEFYVVIPLVFVVLNLLMFVFASKLPKWLVILLLVLQVFFHF
jgi:hypothetical protein